MLKEVELPTPRQQTASDEPTQGATGGATTRQVVTACPYARVEATIRGGAYRRSSVYDMYLRL